MTFLVDKLEKEPKPFMAGRYIARYQSATAAREGLAHIKKWTGTGKWPVEVPAGPDVVAILDRLAAAIGKMKMTLTGATLEIAFDSDQLGGMEALGAAMQSAGDAIETHRRKP